MTSESTPREGRERPMKGAAAPEGQVASEGTDLRTGPGLPRPAVSAPARTGKASRESPEPGSASLHPRGVHTTAALSRLWRQWAKCTCPVQGASEGGASACREPAVLPASRGLLQQDAAGCPAREWAPGTALPRAVFSYRMYVCPSDLLCPACCFTVQLCQEG